MIFKRMGEVQLSDLGLYPTSSADGSYWVFEITGKDVLNRAHFYDNVQKAYLTVYITCDVYIDCLMCSGHVVSTIGNCSHDEYRTLKDLWLETEGGLS